MRSVGPPGKWTDIEWKHSPARCISVTASHKITTENCDMHPSGTEESITPNISWLPLFYQAGTSCSLLIHITIRARWRSWQHLFNMKGTQFLDLHTQRYSPFALRLSTAQNRLLWAWPIGLSWVSGTGAPSQHIPPAQQRGSRRNPENTQTFKTWLLSSPVDVLGVSPAPGGSQLSQVLAPGLCTHSPNSKLQRGHQWGTRRSGGDTGGVSTRGARGARGALGHGGNLPQQGPAPASTQRPLQRA